MTPLLKEKKMEIKIRNVDPVIVKKNRRNGSKTENQ